MTLNSDQVLSIAAETRLFATVRLKSEAEAQLAVQALVEGGVRLVEVTLTTPGALNVIADWRDHPDIIVGAGSILDVDMARQSLAAGARYLVSPHTELDVIRLGCEHGALVAAGAATPTEMMNAMRAGAHIIKVFPAQQLGGPGHLKAVLAPLPFLRLMPTGGVEVGNAFDYLQAGAFCVGLGGRLVDDELVAAGDRAGLVARAREARAAVAPAGLAKR